MSIDRDHAFADGPVLPAEGHSAPWPVGALGKLLARLVRASDEGMVRQAFARGATLGADVLLGRNAWCVNHGSPRDIQLGVRVVCRGVLRREAFGEGVIAIADDVYVGDDCLVSCAERVEIGPATLVAHGAQILDNDTHPLDAAERRKHWRAIRNGGHRADAQIPSAPVTIGRDVWIGFNSTILKGVTLGDGCVIAAGSVVTHDVAAHTVVAGNPARLVRKLK